MKAKLTKTGRPIPARWYGDGLRFSCRPDCGACCVNHGDHTYVYVLPSDVKRLARHLSLPPDEFLVRYTFQEEGHTALDMSGPHCPFLDGTRCTVYPVRPAQCRTFPFWTENVRSRNSWNALKALCPGIDEGSLHKAEAIAESIEARSAERE